MPGSGGIPDPGQKTKLLRTFVRLTSFCLTKKPAGLVIHINYTQGLLQGAACAQTILDHVQEHFSASTQQHIDPLAATYTPWLWGCCCLGPSDFRG